MEKKVFKVTEKQYGILKEYELQSDKKSLLYSRRFGNPIEEDLRRYYNGELNEGYYKTYPIQSVFKYIKRLVGDNGDVRIDRNSGEHPIVNLLTYNNNVKFLEEVNKAFELCGYYKSGENNVNGYDGLIALHYESRYPDNLDKEVKEVGYLYHVSPKKHLEKILKNGLNPRSSNQYFNYPPRVYLLMGYASFEHLLNVIDTLSNGKISQSTLASIKQKSEEWCIFGIDVSKLKDDVQFYADTTMFDGYAIFTYDNIPPSAIELLRIIPT